MDAAGRDERDTYRPPTRDTLAWVARQIGSQARVRSVVRLAGGITADMDRLTVESSGRPLEVVLRRWPDHEAGGLVEREAAALTAVLDLAVPTPRLLALDADGTHAGVRCTLTTVLPGQPDLAPADLPSWLDRLAAAQAAIHGAPGPVPARWTGRYADRARSLEWLTDRGLREAAREAVAGPLDEESVLVHGDYQHFNVLWSGGRLSGVVDWPNAAMGNRGSDVGHCRLNLAVLFGPAAAAEYLAAYERAAGTRVDRRADLQSLLCYTPDWPEFIPRQVAGRAPIEIAGMPDRVAATVRAALDTLG